MLSHFRDAVVLTGLLAAATLLAQPAATLGLADAMLSAPTSAFAAAGRPEGY